MPITSLDKFNKYTGPLEVNVIDQEQISPQLIAWINSNAYWPFQGFSFLELCAKFSLARSRTQHVFIMQNQQLLAYLPLESIPYPSKYLMLLGMRSVMRHQILADYGDLIYAPGVAQDTSLVASILLAVFEHYNKLKINQIVFDYIREDSAIFKALGRISRNFSRKNISRIGFPVMHIVSTKQAKTNYSEVHGFNIDLAKISKLETVKHSLEFDITPTPELVTEIIALHKKPNPKGNKFKLARMEKFYRELLALKLHHWQYKIAILKIFGETAAVMLYYKNKDKILIYDSGHDTNFNYYNPGISLSALFLKALKGSEIKEVDFLRSSQSYKIDLGEQSRQLHKVTVTLD